tara:strand:- start:15 stop:464 length:450 start_codon:yes stop_codon:yes gene_type:complete
VFGRAQLEKGYRGSLEHSIVKDLKKRRAKFEYETLKIRWEEIMYRSYTPDFILRNGIIIEAKGRFLPRERVRAIAIKKQFPELDIRFVFSNSNAKIYKGSKTTLADWCNEYGFMFSDKTIPISWVREKGKKKHPAIIDIRDKRKNGKTR